MSSTEWKQHAYACTVDLAAAHLAKNDREVIGHLVDAIDNLHKAIDAIGGDDAHA